MTDETTETELDVGGSNMTVELRDDELHAKANTGNKQWVAVITDTHPKYNYEREFVAYQKPRTTNRDSGSADIADGDVIENVRYTHSGKNRRNRYYQLVGGEAHEIDEADVAAALGGEIIPDVGGDGDADTESVECDECGHECASDHGVAVHKGIAHADDDEGADEDASMDADSEPIAVADGGEVVEDDADDGPKTLRELGGRQGDAVVRDYSADGHLYAYREGDEHVVVSNGREPGDNWMLRERAERTAVTPGERLWTIPANWGARLTIKGNAEARYAVYRIPETGVHVLVTVPHNNHLVDAWYSVRSVGDLRFEYADACEWDALDTELERYGDGMEDDVREALEQLSRRRTVFERHFAEGVEEFAADALFERRDTVSLDGWTVDPWGDYQFDPDGETIREFLDIDSETLRGVRREFSNAGYVIPSYPEVEPTIDESAHLPRGSGTRALIEAGCSPPEALDYYHTEVLGLSQTAWATARGRAANTISQNVTAAERRLKR